MRVRTVGLLIAGAIAVPVVLVATFLLQPDSVSPADALQGREFELESWSGFSPVPGNQLVLGFDNDAVRFFAGCNGHETEYSIGDDGSLVVSPEFLRTDTGALLSCSLRMRG